MAKQIKSLLVLLILLTVTMQTPLARAEGGPVFNPYWTFRTDAPVTHVETGDINGDGILEVVIVTVDNRLSVINNDGSLAWHYDSPTAVIDLVVADLDGDEQTAEIFIAGSLQTILLSDTQRPARIHEWTDWATEVSSIVAAAIDLDGDGRSDLLHGLGDGYIDVLHNEATLVLSYGYIKSPRALLDLWAGEVDGDERPELVLNLAGGHEVYVFENNLSLAWKKSIEGEVGLVQGGDVDADGLAEVAVLSASWDLFLLESDGQQVWQQSIPTVVGQTPPTPAPGQMVLQDLDGDGRAEIVVLAPDGVYAFNGQGRQLWQQSLGQSQESRLPSGLLNNAAGRLTAGDLDGDGQAEVVAALPESGAVHLLTPDGRHVAEYRPTGFTGAFTYADLNGDGVGEIMVGTESGLQVFGASSQIMPRKMWQSPFLKQVNALALDDLDGDGLGEVVAGSQNGWVYVLAANNGRILWKVNPLPAKNPSSQSDHSVTALSAGDVDNDGQGEIVVATYGVSVGGGAVHLFADNKLIWSSLADRRGIITGMTLHDLEEDGQAEVIVSTSILYRDASLITLLDSAGTLFWEQELAEKITIVVSDRGQVLMGTESGRVYRLSPDRTLARAYDLGAAVLDLKDGLAVTADGRIFRLDAGGPTVIRELGQIARPIQLSARATAILTGQQEVSLVGNDGLIWRGVMDNRVNRLHVGDLSGDGEVEVAASTIKGHVHLFGLTVNQPPLLTNPTLAETRTGYTYSVDVIDPEGDAVPVTLEIWDPSSGTWLTQPAQSLTESQNQGRLSWEISSPFDIWDSGQESRFRFSYDDGQNNGVLQEISGPFNIPTTPWYVYYGQWVGLAALILLVPALGLVLYRRQRQYQQSPQGQAEQLLKQLQAQPEQTLTRLHAVANDHPALLTYLPPLARQAHENAIAAVSERLNLLMVQPEVTAESVGAFIEAANQLEKTPPKTKQGLLDNFSLAQQALEANTINRIVILSPRLNERLTTASAEMEEALAEMSQVIKTLMNFQRVEYIEDKVAYLAQALEALSRFEQGFQPDASPPRLLQPERNVLRSIAARWRSVVNNGLQDLHGRAQINVALKTRQLLSLKDTALSLELTNSGRSPASNLVVSLVSDQPFAVSNGAIKLDILPAGRAATVEVPISAASSVEQFRAEFSITYDDREGEGKVIAFADRVQVLKPAAEFQPIPNPYAPGTPLAPGSSIFFGRDDLFQFINENIAGLTRQNILVLIGQRRMGKTSFLQQLPARLGNEYLSVYIDGQSLGIDPGMANFFYDLSLAIVDALDEQGVELDEPEPEAFEARPSTTFERTFLPAVFEAIGQRKLLFLFDEFEELEMRVTSGKLEPTIFPFLRHLMQHDRRLGFIFVGTHRLEALSTDYWSIFFNIALYKHVTFLDEAAARALIIEPVAEYGLLYDDLALDKMLRVTAGHPYFLQLICHALVNRANREERNYLTIQDVNDVLDEMVELGEAHFAFLWEQSSAQEQLILAALMRLLGQAPSVTGTQVAELLAERGVTMTLAEVTNTLRQLVARDIVREVEGQPPRYEYKIELVRLWMDRYKALGRVIEEGG